MNRPKPEHDFIRQVRGWGCPGWTHRESYEGFHIAALIHRARLRMIFRIVASLPLPETGSLGDFGCSDGYILGLVHERFLRDRGWTLHGFDVKQELLDRAVAKGIPGSTFQYLDLNQSGSPMEGQFDLVFCFETVEHTGNYRNAVLNVVRSCRTGGYLLITTPQEMGWQGLVKLVGRKLLQRDPYGDFFAGKSRWKYVKEILTNGNVEQFRQPPRVGWGPHLGFDTHRFEKFLNAELIDSGMCRIVARKRSFLGFNKLYVIQRMNGACGDGVSELSGILNAPDGEGIPSVRRGENMAGDGSDMGSPPVLRDERTVKYFDSHLPEYSDKRSAYFEDVLNRLATDKSSLVDIGCGAGTLLKQIEKNTPIKKFCGIDVSEKILQKCKSRVDCDVYLGSICDPDFMASVPEKFDFAIVASVLHHLIWKNRKQSMAFAKQAVENSLKVVKEGGYLILLEPTFKPAIMMSALFYLKKFVTKFTTKRIGIFGYWNNIGEPVVSYFTHDQLVAMLASIDGCEIYETFAEKQEISWIIRMAGIWGRANSFVVLRKGAGHGGN